MWTWLLDTDSLSIIQIQLILCWYIHRHFIKIDHVLYQKENVNKFLKAENFFWPSSVSSLANKTKSEKKKWPYLLTTWKLRKLVMNQTENQKKNCQLSRKQWRKKDKKKKGKLFTIEKQQNNPKKIKKGIKDKSWN